MKFTRGDFFKTLTGGAAAAGSLLDAEGPKPKHLDLPRAEPVSLDELKRVGRGMFDVVDAMKYDRVHFNGLIIPQRFSLFATGLGQLCGYTARTKTLAYTNMRQSGYFAPPYQFWLKRIHVFIDPESTLKDARSFSEYGWQFRLIEKNYAEGSCAVDMRSVRLADLIAQGARPAGAARKSLEFEYTAGLYMPMHSFFRFEFMAEREHKLDDMGPGLDIAVGLEGLEVRSIQ